MRQIYYVRGTTKKENQKKKETNFCKKKLFCAQSRMGVHVILSASINHC